jgi:hypothetical protein
MFEYARELLEKRLERLEFLILNAIPDKENECVNKSLIIWENRKIELQQAIKVLEREEK